MLGIELSAPQIRNHQLSTLLAPGSLIFVSPSLPGHCLRLPPIALPPAHRGASRPSWRVLPVRVSHHSGAITTLASVDSACGKLAGTFVNAFVNAGLSNDKLMVEAEVGMMSATASLGLSLLWDTDLSLSHVDKYTYSSQEYIKAGALLATGILNSGVRTEADVAKGLIGKYGDNKSVPLKTSAIMGLALAYAGSHREDLLQLFIPHISYDGNGEITGTILQTLMEKVERNDAGLDEKWARFWVWGFCISVSPQDASDTTIAKLKAIEHQARQSLAVIAVAVIAMGKDVGAEMSLRQFHHLMHYGEPIIRKSVPLTISLVSISNPQLPILGKLKYVRGLVHMDKGTIGLNPFFSDQSIMSWPAIYPRFLIPVDEELKSMPVTVRMLATLVDRSQLNEAN
ncbi:hypothetical protein B0H19DRAFT_1366821 [Mycena capillaripes]|nr:hypothetical protein B0H19DRAFT_1366821 [Mycena capillaripes]